MHGEILSTAVQEAGTALCTRHTQTKTDRQTERERERDGGGNESENAASVQLTRHTHSGLAVLLMARVRCLLY